MAKAAVAPLYADPTTRFVNSLITSEIEVSDTLLSRVWPRLSGALRVLDEDDMAVEAADFDGDDTYEIEFEAEEDDDGFFTNLLKWSPGRRKG